MRRAQGLPLNVIILALLGLAVLVILIVMLSTKTGQFNKAQDCVARGGTCVYPTDPAKGVTCPTTGYPVRSFITCKDDGETKTNGICCLPEVTAS